MLQDMDELNFFQKINLERIEQTLSSRIFFTDLSMLFVWFAICIYTIFFSYFTIIKHYAFATYAWDLGIFAQSFWTTINHGRLLYSTPELLIIPSGSFFGTHFSPIAFLVLPIYAVYSSPETLLVVQSFILALGAFPLYKLSMHILKHRVYSLFFVFVYLLYPPLQGVNWFDFHLQAFLPFFFLSSMYFLEKQNWKIYFLFILLSLSCEEHVSFIVLFIGFFIMLQYRNQLKTIIKNKNFKDTLFLVAIATILLAIFWYPLTIFIRSTFFPVNPVFLSTFKASANWRVLGVDDPIIIPFYIFIYPQRAIIAIAHDFLLKLGFLVILFVPLALTPLSKVKYLIPTFPWFIYSLFSNYQPYYTLYYQYPAYLIAFIFVAAVHSLSDYNLHSLKVKKLLVIFFCSLIAFSVASPISPLVNTVYPQSVFPYVTEHEQLVNEILAYIPPNASLITQSNIFPHISNRLEAYVVPLELIWNSNPSAAEEFVRETLEKVDYVLVDIKRDPFATRKLLEMVKENKKFQVFVSADGVVLFKKNYSGVAIFLAPYNAIYTYKDMILYTGEIVTDLNSTSINVMHFNSSSNGTFMFCYGPRITIPPGNYNLTLKMKIKGVGNLFTVELCSDHGRTNIKSRTFSHLDITPNNTWINYTFNLSFKEPILDFEIRIINLAETLDLYLDYIEIKQLDF